MALPPTGSELCRFPASSAGGKRDLGTRGQIALSCCNRQLIRSQRARPVGSGQEATCSSLTPLRLDAAGLGDGVLLELTKNDLHEQTQSV